MSEEPSGFRRLEAPGALVWVAETRADEIAPLALGEADGLARWLERAGAEPVAGGRARGWRVTLPRSGRVLHVRELAHGGWLRRLTGRRFLRLTRGLRALEAGRLLRERGVDVPEPVLLRALRHGPFWHVELATSFVAASLPAGRVLLVLDPRRTLAMARAAGRAVRAFHDAGGSHPDLHVDNLLVRVTGRPPSVVVTDLEGVRVGAPPSLARRARELARLQRSLRKRGLREPARRRHTAAFVRGYVGRDRALLTALRSRRRPGSRSP